MSDARPPWWVEPVTAAAAGVLRLLGATWRIDRSGMQAVDQQLSGGGQCIFALWHARLLPTLITHRDRGVAVLVSRSRDGELITRVIERLGFTTARGSTTRGGPTGMLEMLSWSEGGRSLAVTPDGPRGPAVQVKPGLVFLASRSGLPVLPVASASSRAWVLRSWDGFRVPQPFSRVIVDYGEMLRVPAQLDDASGEEWRLRIERTLIDLTAAVARRAGEAA